MTTKRRRTRVGLAAPLGLAAVMLGSACQDAGAQYAPSIPFDPWGAAYDAYVYPVAPSNPSIPNGARFNANELGGPNQYNNLMGLGPTALDGGNVSPFSSGMSGRPGAPTGGRYVPYWSVTRPNQKADEAYYSNRERRDELYASVMAERDPVKRAELMKEFQQASLEARRDLGTVRRRNPGGASTTPPASPPSAGAATAPAPTTASERPTRGVLFTKEELARAREAAKRGHSRGTPLETGLPRAGEARDTETRDRSRGSAARPSGGIPAAPPLGGAAPRSSNREAETPDQVLERSRRMGLGSDLDPLQRYDGLTPSRRAGDPGDSPRRPIPRVPAPR